MAWVRELTPSFLNTLTSRLSVATHEALGDMNKDFSFLKIKYLQKDIEENSALEASNKLLVMVERVELALENQYILTSDD